MKKMRESCESLAKIKSVNDLDRDRWFWCDLCDCISYSYGCECYATSCNAAGCGKCRHLHPIVEEAFKISAHPPEEELRLECSKAGGTDETKLLNKIFQEND